MTIKLSDAQLVLLSTAAQRDDRCLVAPQHLKGGAAMKVADKLIGAGFVREIKAKGDMPIWRRDEDEGCNYSLKLTAAGLNAIAVDDGASAGIDAPAVPDKPRPRSTRGERKPRKGVRSNEPKAMSGHARPTAPRESNHQTAGAPREGSKLAIVIALLKRRQGATLEELVAATEWLPHTTRAALTGLRKRAYAVVLDKSDRARGSVYRTEPSTERQAA